MGANGLHVESPDQNRVIHREGTGAGARAEGAWLAMWTQCRENVTGCISGKNLRVLGIWTCAIGAKQSTTKTCAADAQAKGAREYWWEPARKRIGSKGGGDGRDDGSGTRLRKRGIASA